MGAGRDYGLKQCPRITPEFLAEERALCRQSGTARKYGCSFEAMRTRPLILTRWRRRLMTACNRSSPYCDAGPVP